MQVIKYVIKTNVLHILCIHWL